LLIVNSIADPSFTLAKKKANKKLTLKKSFHFLFLITKPLEDASRKKRLDFLVPMQVLLGLIFHIKAGSYFVVFCQFDLILVFWWALCLSFLMSRGFAALPETLIGGSMGTLVWIRVYSDILARELRKTEQENLHQVADLINRKDGQTDVRS
jgi:hypothetical protein